MSWTDIFPVFTDEQVEEFQQKATPEDHALLEEWCGVAEIINPREGRHLVAASLFWKNSTTAEGDLPPISRELMKDARKQGLVSRFAPWDHYVQPLIDGAKSLGADRPDVVFRVYLAADLRFLVEDLVSAGCEVFLMKGSSLRHNPGAMWRFLAIEEGEDRLITITDSDRAPMVIHDIVRTEEILSSGLGLWRAPYVYGGVANNDDPGFYRTMNACHFGVRGGRPIGLLMRAFLWHSSKETMPCQCTIQNGEATVHLPIFGSNWPSYGFDEWFLNAAVYPRWAETGVATFYPAIGAGPSPSHWFTLDIEYVTWANPASEVIYFGQPSRISALLKQRHPKAAESPILDRLRKSKLASRRNLIPEPAREWEKGRATLAVARYREDLEWLLEVPEDITIAVYNKGPEISDPRLLERINHLQVLPNRGREADTYLHHLQSYPHDSGENWTIFVQGDPFPHSPNFLALLRHRDAWKDVQALTGMYKDDNHTPPWLLRELQDDEWIRGLAVRTEYSSARSLGNMSWNDGEGAYRCFQDYADFYNLPRGWSLTGHFVEKCGLVPIAEEAWRAVVVRYAYAAIFAVKNSQLGLIPKHRIEAMREMTWEHYSIGFMFERMWLHLFGLPFLTESALFGFEQQEKFRKPGEELALS
ncbi:DUF3431 domain-containing protein [Luteolibacter sp. GHJ8]|uniref:DUF3431 domain-containing protein n=1 Tax=Luteolibacter rhizosphaerae TaxID=2989719 RepID=A0ABT3G739_9BACT|nr:DUF3431 domain-containing protein [Luteolibacter rhizosphaerae]MCW1915663.1 DUF3431 domain-containing protein [Luteolibacter rhizosphaerae]